MSAQETIQSEVDANDVVLFVLPHGHALVREIRNRKKQGS